MPRRIHERTYKSEELLRVASQALDKYPTLDRVYISDGWGIVEMTRIPGVAPRTVGFGFAYDVTAEVVEAPDYDDEDHGGENLLYSDARTERIVFLPRVNLQNRGGRRNGNK